MASKGLLDLPATALTLVCSNLGRNDKKNLALTCTALSTVIRPLWTCIIVDLSSEDPPPRRLSSFSAVSSIVVADLLEADVSTCRWPAFYEEYEEPDDMIIYDTNSLKRLSNAIAMLQTATPSESTNSPGDVQRPKLSLVVGLPGRKTGRVLQSIVQSISSDRAQHDITNVALASVSMLSTASNMLTASSVGGAGSPNCFPTSEAGLVKSYIDKLIAHPAFSESLAADVSVLDLSSNSNSLEMVEAMFKRTMATLDHLALSVEDSSPSSPFDSVDAGWFIPDGHLKELICQGTVSWCADAPADQFQLEVYTRMHTLRLCVADCDPEEVDAAFSTTVLPKLNALQGLCDLHLGRADDAEFFIDFEADCLTLPALTHLALDLGFLLESFSGISHLQKLSKLSVNLNIPEDLWQLPQDIASLSSLSSLSYLSVNYLCVHEPQNIQLLQQLSFLNLFAVRGFVEFILPTAPMPNLRVLHIDLLFSTKIDHDPQDCDNAINWFMDNAATTFPNIEQLDLGIESIKMPLTSDRSVNMAAASMNRRVRKLLFSSLNMKHFRMTQARCQMPSLLDEGFTSGAVGASLSEELDVRCKTSGRIKWRREVEFETTPARRGALELQVYYEYHRKKD